MDLMPSSFLPGDPRMVDQIVYELKSQGIFDQFRKECIADVDTKPAYQNLRQRVEGSVMNFLKKRKFASDTNKNQLREQLRKNITESGFLESGVERIVDQVVNPKISSVFLPKVEEVVYRFLGIQKPESASTSQDDKVKTEDLLPTDLEAVSPESVHETSKVSAGELSSENVESANNETNNTSLTKTDDESPPFEPLEENTKFSMQEDNSVDSRYSEASGNDSVLEASNQPMNISENSQINGNSNMASLSEDVKMDICDNTMTSENSDKLEIVEDPKETKLSDQKTEEKHKSDSSKRSHDKYKSSKSDKHREDSKDKRERSKSESKSKDKSISRHSSSSSKDKDKKDEPSEKEFNLEKYKIPKKEENDKNKDGKKKSEKSGDRDKSSSKDQSDKPSKERTKSERDRHDKERSSSHKSKERSSSSSKKDDKDRKHRDERDDKSSKDKSSSSSKSSSSKKESSSKDKSSKDKPKSSSSSKDKEKTSDSKRTHEDSKSSKRDKHKGHESSSKKEKEKSVSDDHYSFKNKKRERRSTDRDSNDGSGKTNRNETLVDSTSENSSKSSKKGTSENFSSGGDSSSNSDKVEKCNKTEEVAASTNAEHVQPIKYIKPKFASNMEEAIKIMKIRKQLAKLERENQLTLLQIPQQNELTTEESAIAQPAIAPEIPPTEVNEKPPEEDTPVLKSQDLSPESFEALEARLAQEMSNIGDHMYGDEDDENYESSAISVDPRKKRKVDPEEELKEIDASDANAGKKVKFNGGLVHTENTTTTKSEKFCDKENHIVENSVSQIPKKQVSEEFTGYTAAESKCSEEIMKKTVEAYFQYMTGKTVITTQDPSTKLVTTLKTIDNRLFIKLDKMDLKPNAEVKTKQNGDISATGESEEPCYYFQKESLLVSQKRLAVLNSYVVRLEQNLEEGTPQNRRNVSHIIKRGLKRKLQGTENNNSLNCNYKPPTKRNHLSNANSNETVCNTSLTLVVDVSSHPDFSLPLSPAESEKSGENKKEEPVMVKPKRVSGSATKRYSSADLYKPRPVLSGSSTRRRTARTLLDSPKP